MSGLAYVGPDPSNSNEISNRGVTNTRLSSAVPNQASVTAQVAALTSGGSATYASVSYVDGQDALYQPPSYYQTQDALNVLNTAVGVGGGVAALDSGGKVPVLQLPILGLGYLQAPYGPTAVFTGTTSNTPLKIADWNLGNIALTFRPLVFMSVFALGAVSRPIVEVRIANSTTAVSYAAGTTVAMGQGRTNYNDYHSIPVVPVGDGTTTTPVSFGPNYNVWLSAWIYDANAQTVTVSSGGVVGGWCGLLRTAT